MHLEHTRWVQMGPPPRRVIVLGLLTTLILALLLTAHLTSASESALAVKVGDKVSELLQTGTDSTVEESSDKESSDDEIKDEEEKDQESVLIGPYDHGTEKGSGGVGKHVHVRPSAPTPKSAAIAGCKYPVVIHVTPDGHCTGALALYGSIVRNVLMQPEALRGKTCVHMTYVDPKMTSIEEMYKWTARSNPYGAPKDCAALDSTPSLNAVVPIRFQALRGIEKPDFMETKAGWLVALNKVHSWAFDAYPRILLMDADSILVTDLHLIFDESDDRVTVTGASDQFNNCGDRNRLNGGMILLRPSRYFQISALEMIYDQDSSCVSRKWQQSEQELLNCICGTQGPPNGLRPEFRCAIMPLYNSVWPRNYACSAANVLPMRSIHFTALVTKPWKVDDTKLASRFDYRFWECVRDATRKGTVKALKACKFAELEESRKLDQNNNYMNGE